MLSIWTTAAVGGRLKGQSWSIGLLAPCIAPNGQRTCLPWHVDDKPTSLRVWGGGCSLLSLFLRGGRSCFHASLLTRPFAATFRRSVFTLVNLGVSKCCTFEQGCGWFIFPHRTMPACGNYAPGSPIYNRAPKSVAVCTDGRCFTYGSVVYCAAPSSETLPPVRHRLFRGINKWIRRDSLPSEGVYVCERDPKHKMGRKSARARFILIASRAE